MDELLKQVGGILTYRTSGHRRPCGQTVGADGSGTFCIIFSGSPEDAEDKARAYIRKLELDTYVIENVLFVANDDNGSFYGNPIKVERPVYFEEE